MPSGLTAAASHAAEAGHRRQKEARPMPGHFCCCCSSAVCASLRADGLCSGSGHATEDKPEVLMWKSPVPESLRADGLSRGRGHLSGSARTDTVAAYVVIVRAEGLASGAGQCTTAACAGTKSLLLGESRTGCWLGKSSTRVVAFSGSCGRDSISDGLGRVAMEPMPPPP
mmetsp:Transcript_175488/g.426799  ORF Transcript_175488/g.426799 Transcript_175488/m.426799 type:complete len:170 (+) Transcript_175488:85-594(+)